MRDHGDALGVDGPFGGQPVAIGLRVSDDEIAQPVDPAVDLTLQPHRLMWCHNVCCIHQPRPEAAQSLQVEKGDGIRAVQVDDVRLEPLTEARHRERVADRINLAEKPRRVEAAVP